MIICIKKEEHLERGGILGMEFVESLLLSLA
jgi:hypothetical protein